MNTIPAILVWLAGTSLALGALAQQTPPADPTPRKNMAPSSATKVRIYEAKRWRNFGVDADTVTRQVVSTAAGQTRTCNTSIGPGAATTQSGYRPARQGDSTVIVAGDVINVCK